MHQRRYRPGDVLDDYCPRERRITDHAVVAMIEDDIKQTRCVVCDAEHEYKDGKVPAQRRKKPQAALFAEVLEGLQPPQPAARLAAQSPGDAGVDEELVAVPVPEPVIDAVAPSYSGRSERVETAPPLAAAPVADVPFHEPVRGREDGPVRRQLIRAALPRPEGQPPPQPVRALPEFTVRQPRHRGQGQGNGNGHGQGHGHGQGQGHGRRHAGGGQGGFGQSAASGRFGRNSGQGRPRRRRGKKG